MGFKHSDVVELLVQCHRRCCVCHRFCGTKIETDHIVPVAESGSDLIENAIPLCFDCHAEVHAYNNKHPRGRKFTADELREHKRQWLDICSNKPEALLQAAYTTDLGPLQSMFDELEYNHTICKDFKKQEQIGFIFRDKQLSRAIQAGALSMLSSELREDISLAYGAMSKANLAIKKVMSEGRTDSATQASGKAFDAINDAKPLIKTAKKTLLAIIRSEDSAS